MPKYNLYLFDLDDTLLSFRASAKSGYEEIIKELDLGHINTTFDDYLKKESDFWRSEDQSKIEYPNWVVNGATKRDYLWALWLNEYFKDYLNITLDEALLLFDTYQKGFSKIAEPMPGSLELLRKLYKTATIVIATVGEQSIERCKACGIDNYIDLYHRFEDCSTDKTDPLYFKTLFRRLGITNKNNSLMVGNSLHSDIVGANSFGLDTCWYNPNSVSNDTNIYTTYEIKHLLELKK